MNKKTVMRLLLLLVLGATLLSACSTASLPFDRPDTPAEPAEDAGLGVKIKWWLTEVAWSAATVPVIGPLVAGILGEMAPGNHWIVGGIIILFTLGLFKKRSTGI